VRAKPTKGRLLYIRRCIQHKSVPPSIEADPVRLLVSCVSDVPLASSVLPVPPLLLLLLLLGADRALACIGPEAFAAETHFVTPTRRTEVLE